MKKLLVLLFIICLFAQTFAQVNGIIRGNVKDVNTQQALEAVEIILTSSTDSEVEYVVVTDENGNFSIQIPVGNYNLETFYLGYSNYYQYNINLGSGNAQLIQIELEEESIQLTEAVISTTRSVKATDMTTPLATQRLSAEEIKINPGGNFDVSKVIQALPGVAGGTTPNRNDIIVRGGGPSENVYYLDGIEIPVLNHFQTQGASGGATGILNVSFIQDAQLTSSAFDSKYGNALASTLVINQRNGNPDKLSGNIRLSGSEFAAMLEGPLAKNTTFMASARRSYLQFLFEILDLPIRPDYYDFQYKVNHKIDNKTELNFIGIGAIDNFKLETPKNSDANNEYTTRANPLINQWNYTVGASLKRLINDGYYTVALSRNMFYNGAERYENNATKEGDKLYELNSHEIENKLRVDFNRFKNGWKYSYGIDVQYVKYDAEVFNTVQREITDSIGNIVIPTQTFNSKTAIDFYKIGAYGHVSKYFLDGKFLISAGARTDINTFTNDGNNPLKAFSPRISFAYNFNPEWNVSASVGSYYKIPSYTMLGFVDEEGNLKNKDLKYINAIHYTVGAQFVPKRDLRFTLEAFYKTYNNYPVSLESGISYANIGTDFSAVGSENYSSIGKGRVYGIEAYVQQQLIRSLFYVASATIYKSEFSGLDGKYKPSTWDYNFVFSTTFGYKFRNNWDVGLKYRLAGGQPYTPFDIDASISNYLTTGKGVYDYSQLNDKRLPVFSQLDFRIDKKFNFKQSSLSLFLDFQNILFYKTPYLPKFSFERTDDNSGFKTTDGQPIKTDGSNAIPIILEQESATIVPSIGFIFEF